MENLNARLIELKVAELRELASELDIELEDGLKKKEIIDVIESGANEIGYSRIINNELIGPISERVFGSMGPVGPVGPPGESMKGEDEESEEGDEVVDVEEVLTKEGIKPWTTLTKNQIRNMPHQAIKGFARGHR